MPCPKIFNVILISDSYFYNITETGEALPYENIDMHLLRLLSETLGFSYKLYPTPPILLPPQHLFVGHSIMEEYMFKSMSYPHKFTDITFATIKPNYASGTFSCFNIFSPSVWMFIFLSVVLASCLHRFLFRKTSFVSAFFYTFGTLVQKYHDWKPKTRAQKIFVLTWICGIMFISLSYGSALLSFLTFPSREKGIQNFDDLYRALREGKATAVGYKDSDLTSYLYTMEDEMLSYFGDEMYNHARVNYNDLMKGLKQNVALIGDRGVIESILKEHDEYFISPDSIYNIFDVIYDLTKGKRYRQCHLQIDDAIHRIFASGLLKKEVYDNSKRKQAYQYKNKNVLEDPVRPLSLSHLSGAFYVLLTGYLLGFICLICEICTKRFL